jgi:hypothetical protein
LPARGAAALIFTHSTIRALAEALAIEAEGTSAAKQVLRSTNRVGLGQSTRRLLGQKGVPAHSALFGQSKLMDRSKSLVMRHAAARLTAESLSLGAALPHHVGAARMPRWAYTAVQLVLCSLANAVVPASNLVFLAALLHIWMALGLRAALLAWPVLWILQLAYLALVLVFTKGLLFPRGMTPGVFPVFGWTYARWARLAGAA